MRKPRPGTGQRSDDTQKEHEKKADEPRAEGRLSQEKHSAGSDRLVSRSRQELLLQRVSHLLFLFSSSPREGRCTAPGPLIGPAAVSECLIDKRGRRLSS